MPQALPERATRLGEHGPTIDGLQDRVGPHATQSGFRVGLNGLYVQAQRQSPQRDTDRVILAVCGNRVCARVWGRTQVGPKNGRDPFLPYGIGSRFHRHPMVVREWHGLLFVLFGGSTGGSGVGDDGCIGRRCVGTAHHRVLIEQGTAAAQSFRHIDCFFALVWLLCGTVSSSLLHFFFVFGGLTLLSRTIDGIERGQDQHHGASVCGLEPLERGSFAVSRVSTVHALTRVRFHYYS